MANLIITIISIALVAVAALMAAYYGGSAFMEGQAKSQANRILNHFRQTDAAIKVWATNNGGNLPSPVTNFPVSSGSTTTFSLSQMASFLEPAYVTASFFTSTTVTVYQGTSLWNPVLVVRDHSYPLLTEEVCKTLDSIRTGVKPATLFPWTSTNSTTINQTMCGDFGCFDANGSWGATKYVAYFRLNGRPLTAGADCTINR